VWRTSFAIGFNQREVKNGGEKRNMRFCIQ